MKKCFFPFLAVFLLGTTLFSFAQQPANKASAIDNASWQPAKISSDGQNSINGVEFLKKIEKCNGEELLLVRAINKNNYPINIQWINLSGKKESITLRSSSQMEGTCLAFVNKTGPNNENKLSLLKSDKEAKKQFLSTLTVIKAE